MRAGALLVLLLLALLLGGCGGGADLESTSEATGAQEQRSSAVEQELEAQGQGEGPGDLEPNAEPNPPQATERVPGSKAVAPGVPIAKGGDDSIQTFGLEGEEDQAEQATAELQAYLNARANGEWAKACEAASAQYREQLARMVAPTPDEKEPKGCEETLQALFGKAPQKTLEETAQLNRVLSFRVEADGYAYLIYEAGDAVKFIAMANDNGAWKVNTLEPAEFPEAQGQGSNQ